MNTYFRAAVRCFSWPGTPYAVRRTCTVRHLVSNKRLRNLPALGHFPPSTKSTAKAHSLASRVSHPPSNTRSDSLTSIFFFLLPIQDRFSRVDPWNRPEALSGHHQHLGIEHARRVGSWRSTGCALAGQAACGCRYLLVFVRSINRANPTPFHLCHPPSTARQTPTVNFQTLKTSPPTTFLALHRQCTRL